MSGVHAGSETRIAAETGGGRLDVLPPLTLYVHVPWCVRKCPYCDFNSHELRGGLPEEAYVDALVADLEHARPSVWGRKVHAVFFGGGTPSLLSASAIECLLAAIWARLEIEPDAEVTLEANPGAIEAAKFPGFAAAGVNRLSIGVQSFAPRSLRALGRIHSAREAVRAIALARTHFTNFNLDLMYALPGQTVEAARADLAAALAAGAPHLSFYHLTIEPNTLFHRHPPALPDDEVQADVHELVQGTLATAGYRNYETSAYALPGHECRHNLNYWRFGDYLGIGAGAHAKLSFGDRIVRQVRFKHPREYFARVAAGAPVQEERTLGRGDLVFEFALNALRLVEGFELPLFVERTGLAPAAIEDRLARAEARGLVAREGERVRPTERGRRFLNDLLELFLPEKRA